MKNYGFDLSRELAGQSEKDWVFGATAGADIPCIAEIPLALRDNYLPVGEVQKGREDFMDCATRGPLNILEAKLTYGIVNSVFSEENARFLLDHYWNQETKRVELSDRFNAVLSNTTRTGNSMKAPLDSIRKDGVLPKRLLPAREDMTWDEYHDRKAISNDMIALGIEFAKRFQLNYAIVYENDYPKLIDIDFLDVAGYAWPAPVDGEYPRTENQPNHVFAIFGKPEYRIFDNYVDPVDGDFIKKLSPNYDFLNYGYRVFISSERELIKESSLTLIGKLLEAIKSLLGLDKQVIAQLPTPIPELAPAPKYLWGTPEEARHSVRVICDEEGLKLAEKNLICAVIQAESGFKNTAKNQNKNYNGVVTSTDWGLCQINDWYHCGPNKTFPSVQWVLDNPDKVVRWMIEQYRKGNLKWWIAFRNGSYKSYL